MFEIGHTFVVSTVIGDEDVQRAAAVVGGLQPLHQDRRYAERTHFRRRVAPEAVILGRMTGLLEAGLVDPKSYYAVIDGINVNLTTPVYPGDELVVHARVVTWNNARGRLSVVIDVRNQQDEPVLVGQASLNLFPVASRN